jgi:phage baseplate assembly protein W
MPFDLETSTLGDLTFTGGRDLSVVSGASLIRQRIMFRLKLPRGSYRLNKNIGSEIHSLLRMSNTAENRARGVALVMQALRPMSDIAVDTVEIIDDPNDSRRVIIRLQIRMRVSRGGPEGTLSGPFIIEIAAPIAPFPTDTAERPQNA